MENNMSFFQSLKEDLSTTMNDLIPENAGEAPVNNIPSDVELTFPDGEPLMSNSSLDDVMFSDGEPVISDEPGADEPVKSAIDSLKNASRRYEEEKAESSNADTESADVSGDLDDLLKLLEIDNIPEVSDEKSGETVETEEIASGEEEVAEEEVQETEDVKADDSSDTQLEFDLNAMLQSLEESGADTVEEPVAEETPVAEEVPAEEPAPENDAVLDDLMREYKEKFAAEAAASEAVAEEPVAEETVIAEETPVEETHAEVPTEEPVIADIPEISEEPVKEEPAAEAPVVTETPAKPKKKKADHKKAKIPEIEQIPLEQQEISEETAVIAEGMKVVGNIECTGNIDLAGEIKGDVSLLGKLDVTGKITGKVKAFEVFADGAKINGDISSNGSVKLGQDTVVIGNITGASAVIAGAVKGDIDVHGPVILDTSAIVMGDIKSMSVQINNGAVIEGMCSQCYATVNPSAFFDDFRKGNKAE